MKTRPLSQADNLNVNPVSQGSTKREPFVPT